MKKLGDVDSWLHLSEQPDLGHWVAKPLLPGNQVALVVKNLPANLGDLRDEGLIPGLGRFPWRKAWQPSPVFLPGESHGQRNLLDYSPWGHTQWDTTEVT